MNLYQPKKEFVKQNGITNIFFNPFRIAAIIITLALFSILVYLVFVGFLNNIFFSNNDIFVERSISTDKEFLLAKVTDLGELSTAEYIIEKEIGTIIDYNNLELPGGISFDRSKTQVAQISGSVKAGIDLGDITEEDILIEDKKITIDVPSAKVLDVNIEEEKTELVKDSSSLLVSIESLYPQRRLEFENQIRSEVAFEAKKQVREAACSKDIIAKSTQNANELIEKLYLDSGFEEVLIKNKEGGDC